MLRRYVPAAGGPGRRAPRSGRGPGPADAGAGGAAGMPVGGAAGLFPGAGRYGAYRRRTGGGVRRQAAHRAGAVPVSAAAGCGDGPVRRRGHRRCHRRGGPGPAGHRPAAAPAGRTAGSARRTPGKQPRTAGAAADRHTHHRGRGGHEPDHPAGPGAGDGHPAGHAWLYNGGDHRPVWRIHLRHDAVHAAAVIYLSPVGKPDAGGIRRADPPRPRCCRNSGRGGAEADGAGGPARRRGTVGAGGAYPAPALSRSAGNRRGGGLSPDVPGPGLRVRMPDGGHQRRPAGLRPPAAAGDLPSLRRHTEDRHQLPDGRRSRHGHSGRSGEHAVLLRADRGHQPGSHRTAGAGASGVYLPVCQARSSDGGDGAGGPVRLWPVLPPSAREMGGTAGGAAGRRCIRGAGAGHRRRDAAGSSDHAERGKAG